jgi:tryptophanyl-tRNA synthetase
VTEEFSGKGFGAFKPALADLLVATIEPIRARLARFAPGAEDVEAILAKGSARAAELGAPTLAGAYRALGLPR